MKKSKLVKIQQLIFPSELGHASCPDFSELTFLPTRIIQPIDRKSDNTSVPGVTVPLGERVSGDNLGVYSAKME